MSSNKKFIVAVRDGVKTIPEADSLRGESRWERQVLRALMEDETIQEIRGFGVISEVDLPKVNRSEPKNYRDLIGVTHDLWPGTLRKDLAGLITTIYSGPWPHEEEIVQDLFSVYNHKFVLAYSFKDCHIGSFLEEKFGKDCTEFLPTPAVPNICTEDAFSKQNILWIQRNILNAILGPPENLGSQEQVRLLTEFLASKLKKDPQRQLCIVAGCRPTDLKWLRDCTNWCNFDSFDDAFWSSSSTEPLMPFRDRVIMKPVLGWNEAMDLFKTVKLAVGAPGPYGALPMELGSFGVPFITKPDTGSMLACNEYLGLSFASEEYLEALDRLYEDEKYFHKVGNAYRDFVAENHTNAAFVKNLYRIVDKRGM